MRVASNTYDDARLIQEVQKYPTLYDSRQRGYKDRPMKAIAWQTVADALDLQANEAKTRWRYIRDRYVREKKQLLNEGEQVYQQKDPWPLLDELSFLWEFISHRKQVYPSDDGSNEGGGPNKKKRVRTLQPILPWPSPEWVNVTLDYETPDDDESASDRVADQEPKRIKLEPQQGETEPESQLRRLLEDRVSEVDELHPLEDDPNDEPTDTKEQTGQDEDELYCLSVAAAFKRFSPKMKALAKWKIQQVLYDVEFNQPGTSSPPHLVPFPR